MATNVIDLGTRQELPGKVAGPGDTGAAQAAQSIAADFAAIGAKIGGLADHAAAAEGAEAGRIAGLDPEFRPTHNRTIRSDAYDQAGLQIAGAQLKQHIGADFAGAFEKHSADPKKLAEVLKAKGDAWLGGTAPELKPEATLEVQAHTFSLLREASRNRDNIVMQQQAAALQTQIHEGLRQLSQQAYNNGLDPAADKMAADQIAALRRRLSATDVRGRPLVAPGEAEKIIERATQEVATSRTVGAFDRLPDVASKEAFIKQFRADFGQGAGTAGQYDFAHFHSVERLLMGELSRAKAEGGAALREVSEQVNAVVKLAEKGRAPDRDVLAAIEAQVSTLGASAKDEKLKAKLDDAHQILEWTRTAQVSTPADLDAFLRREDARMKEGGATLRQSALVDHGRQLLTHMREGLKTDALGWADGRLFAVPPLDMTSPDKLAASITARLPRAAEVGAYYGQEAQYIRPDERRAIASGIAQGGEAGAKWLAAVAGGAGDRAPAVFKELHEDHAPVVAKIGASALSIGPGAPVVRDALDGLALRKVDGARDVAPLPKPDQVRAALTDVLSDTLARQPKDEAALVAMTNAAYEARAHRLQIKTFDPDLWKQVMREAVGERQVSGAAYGGIVPSKPGLLRGGSSSIVLPPDVKQKTWRQVIDAIVPDDLASAGLGTPTGGDGKPIPLDRLRKAALIQYGDGQYAMATGDPARPGQEGLVLREDKRPFILDFKKLTPAIRARRPDLFLGG